eukprot:55212-Eustigmatos_ZCMA.PRE.1
MVRPALSRGRTGGTCLHGCVKSEAGICINVMDGMYVGCGVAMCVKLHVHIHNTPTQVTWHKIAGLCACSTAHMVEGRPSILNIQSYKLMHSLSA